METGLFTFVKKVIHSLVVSSPTLVSVEKLERDYFKEEGCQVPYFKLGYRSLETFLLSISDTVVLHGYGPMATVYPVMNVKTAHIQSLVQSQKKIRPRQRVLHSKPRFAFESQRSNLVFTNEKYNRYNRPPPPIRRRSPAKPPTNYAQYKAQQNGEQVEHKLSESLAKISIVHVDEDSSEAEKNNEEIWISDDELLINKQEKEELPPLVNKEEEEEPCEEYASSDDGRCSDDEAIPTYALDARVFEVDYPQGVMRLPDKLPKRDVAGQIFLYDRLQVQVVRVDSPCDFSFWQHDDQYDDYKGMTHGLQTFYNQMDVKKYYIPKSLTIAGQMCAVRSRFGSWERAQIMKVIPSACEHNIEVELVDTGLTMRVIREDLKFLAKEFAELPAQCIKGRLACVTPVQGSSWSLDAIDCFFQLVHNRVLYAKVERIGELDDIYMVLVDPEAQVKNVNYSLIEAGHALRRCLP